MIKTIEQRLLSLKRDQAKGQDVLMQLDAQKAELNQSLTRIEGAIQVLTELLSESKVTNIESADAFFAEDTDDLAQELG